MGVTDSDPHGRVPRSYSGGMTSHEPSPRDAVRAEIREFLSTRRARITPEQAGLPTYGDDRRRVPGLRREETALLVGVSPQYYIRLERGDATGVSDSVIDGIAHALKLDDAERAHLLDLLRTAGAPSRSQDPTPSPATRRIRPTIQRLIDAMPAVPAVVLNGRLDVLGSNALGRALFAPLDADRRPARTTPGSSSSTRESTTFFREWDTVANDTVALLRAEAGRDPYDRELSRPDRRTVHPQRGLPRPVGRTRRPHPQHRHQEAAPPGRRRPRPAVRVPPHRGRLQHQPGHLPARTRLPLPRRPRPARQLGSQRHRSPQHRATRPAPPPLS